VDQVRRRVEKLKETQQVSNIFAIIGFIVVVMFVLGYLGMR
jgi:hypothetical protein